MKTEQWLPVPGYEGLYEVSDQGIICSLDYRRTGKKKNITGGLRSGYWLVGLSRNGKRKFVAVHRLVLKAFVGPCPGKRYEAEARHLDGNKLNNVLSNLCWGTRQQNAEDRIRHGTARGPRGKKNPNNKLEDDDVLAIYHARGFTQRELGARYSVSHNVVGRIRRGEMWAHLTGAC